MRTLVISFLLVVSCASSYAQYDFLFERKSLEDIRKYEESINSEQLGFIKTQVAKNYFPTAKEKHDYYPLCFARINDNFYPQLETSYFYDEIDSTLLATSYDWNIMRYVKNLKTDGDKLEREKEREKDYLTKYNGIKQVLTNTYGEPTIIEEDKSNDGYFYRLRWTNESNEILVIFQFSSKLKELPGNMKVGSFSIRVKVNYL